MLGEGNTPLGVFYRFYAVDTYALIEGAALTCRPE